MTAGPIAKVSLKEAFAVLDTLGALGLWAPWKLSKADQEAGAESPTSRTSTAKLLLQLAEEAGVGGDALVDAAAHWTESRWPAPRELLEVARRRSPTTSPARGGCPVGPRESCNEAGLISVSVHYLDAEGLPAVWNGACYCDCERGQAAAARQGLPLEGSSAPRRPGVTLAALHAHFGTVPGRLVEMLVAPEPWQTRVMGDPRRRPPSREAITRAEAALREMTAAQGRR